VASDTLHIDRSDVKSTNLIIEPSKDPSEGDLNIPALGPGSRCAVLHCHWMIRRRQPGRLTKLRASAQELADRPPAGPVEVLDGGSQLLAGERFPDRETCAACFYGEA
jgi:hypothetical protein